MSRKAWIGIAVALLALCGGRAFAVDEISRPMPGGLPAQIQTAPIKYGESCRRINDGATGVFKRDGCGRTYCGLVNVKDIVELQPNFAAEHACTWQLAGPQCRCLKASKP
jgi:hypothetical protein